MSPKYKIFLVAFLLSLAIDQGTKNWVTANLTYTDRIEVVEDFFYITHVRNPGAAFGLLADAPKGVRDFLFIGVAMVAIGIIFSFQHKLAPGDRLSALALGLILGGAVGNLTDRIFHNGEVVDFLHFRLWTGYVWPDFNFADSFIVVGVGLLILELLATEGEQRNEDLDASNAPSGSAE